MNTNLNKNDENSKFGEFKGTKGKWELDELQFRHESYINTNTHRVCEVKHYEIGVHRNLIEPTFEEGRANALLISKAPEMLEMIKRLTSLLADIDSTLFHHNHSVNGWHLNGDAEPMMNFVAEMDMNALSDAEELIKQATEI